MQSPILVLKKGDVEDYVESNFMTKWRQIYPQVQQQNDPIIKTLMKADCFLQYYFDQAPSPLIKEIVPNGLESWAKSGYQRVWDVKSYHPVLSNAAIQEIFFPTKPSSMTANLAKEMNLHHFVDYLPNEEVKATLRAKMKEQTQSGESIAESLSLLAMLPRMERFEFALLIEADPRSNGEHGVNLSINAYYHHLRTVVNPANNDFTVLYGCSGADALSVFYATNPTEAILVDFTQVKANEVLEAIQFLKQRGPLSELMLYQKLGKLFFEAFKRFSGSSSMMKGDGTQSMPELALRLVFNLMHLGVDLKTIKVKNLENNEGIQLQFPWKHHSEHAPKQRQLTFITADITKPNEYPKALKERLDGKLDAFFMKSAFTVPLHYHQFLPQIAQNINENGFLMTADKTFFMESCDPGPALQKANLEFSTVQSPEQAMFEVFIEPPFDPLVGIGSLQLQRHNRTPGSDQSYWTNLTLRQKKR